MLSNMLHKIATEAGPKREETSLVDFFFFKGLHDLLLKPCLSQKVTYYQ